MHGPATLLLAVLAAAAAASASPASAGAAAPRKAGSARFTAPAPFMAHPAAEYVEALAQLNNARHYGAPRMCYQPHLMAAAQQQASDMARGAYLAHVDRAGRSPFDRMTTAGYAFVRAAENIAYGSGDEYTSPLAPVKAWLASAGHLKNIQGGYPHMGIGHAAGACPGGKGHCHYWAQTFGDAPDAACLPDAAPVAQPAATPVTAAGAKGMQDNLAAAPAPASAAPASDMSSFDAGMLGTPDVETAASVSAEAAYQHEFLALVNAHRAHRGRPAVCLSVPLLLAAQRQANDVATKVREMSHLGFDGSHPDKRMLAAGFTGAIKTAEIMGAGGVAEFGDAAQMVLLWRDSQQGHDEVLEDWKWTHAGVARARGKCPGKKGDAKEKGGNDEECFWWIATFGESKDAACVPAAKQ